MKSNFLNLKKNFSIPEGTIYLCGNSLGPPLKSMGNEVKKFVDEEWAKELVKGWNSKGWFEQSKKIGNQIAKIVGADKETIIVGDTLSTQVFQALTCALKLNQNRRYVLTDNGNFPADIYIAEGLLKLLGDKHELKIVKPEDIIEHINDEVAVILLTEADYRTGKIYDMKNITHLAHSSGALVIWDLAHTAGVLPIKLSETKADFAVGCTYKYLNGGPGSPAFIYIAPNHINKVEPALFGWHGHKNPFEFNLNYLPSSGIEKMKIGSPSIISFASLKHALDIWDNIDMNELRLKSIELSELFISEIDKLSIDLNLVSPRDPYFRGNQVSYSLENGYAFMQALIQENLIGDFRSPNLIRFGFSPIYLDEQDIINAVAIIGKVSRNSLWRKFSNQSRKIVT